jgi:hypothetical protein
VHHDSKPSFDNHADKFIDLDVFNLIGRDRHGQL